MSLEYSGELLLVHFYVFNLDRTFYYLMGWFNKRVYMLSLIDSISERDKLEHISKLLMILVSSSFGDFLIDLALISFFFLSGLICSLIKCWLMHLNVSFNQCNF